MANGFSLESVVDFFSGNVNSVNEYIAEGSETLKLWKTKVMFLNLIK